MEVAPALAPHRGAVGPALVVAREQHLERLREARLPRAVAAHHQRQSRPRLDLELGRWADPAEALDGDRREVRADRLRRVPRLQLLGQLALVEKQIDRTEPAERAQDELP